MSGQQIARDLAVSPATVSRVLRRLGLNTIASLEPAEPVRRYERETPGELIHIDIKKLGRFERTGHRITGDRTSQSNTRGIGWEYLHLAIDDHSRLAYSEILPNESLLAAGLFHDVFLGSVSLFWLLLMASNVFVDGGFAVVGPYSAEVWPSSLRTTGMGSAYGVGGIGKIVGPLGLALIVGSSNVVAPQATLGAVMPAFAYLSAWFALMAVAFAALAFETRGRSIDELDAALEGAASRSLMPLGTASADSC